MGLLDFDLSKALNSDRGRLGLGLLAAAGPSNQGFGQRLQSALGYVQGQQDRDRMQKEREQAAAMQQMQMQEIQSQAELRKAQAAREAQKQEMLKNIFSPQSTGQGLQFQGIRAPQQQSGLAGLSIDDVARLKAFGGIDIMDAYKWSRDPLKLDPGATYQDRTSGKERTIPKLPEGAAFNNGAISAIPGYTGYVSGVEAAKEAAKADYDIAQPITTPSGKTMQGTRGQVASAMRGASAFSPAAESDRAAILCSELTKADNDYKRLVREGNMSAASRAKADAESIRREMGGARSPQIGMEIQSEAGKLRANEAVKSEQDIANARAKDVKTAQKFIAQADLATNLLKQKPTASGLGSMVDSASSFFGYSPAGAATAQKLKAVSGWLVSNVPRMEGPQSNFDVDNYKTMAADVGNDKLPIERRLAALSEIQRMMRESSGMSEQTTGGAPTKQVKRTGTYNGRKVIEYADGSVEYGN